MDSLLSILYSLEADTSVPTREFVSLGLPIVDSIVALAETLLINDQGLCNWENINSLIDSGYHVFPVERDMFGWIVGGIHTTKGVITYG